MRSQKRVRTARPVSFSLSARWRSSALSRRSHDTSLLLKIGPVTAVSRTRAVWAG